MAVMPNRIACDAPSALRKPGLAPAPMTRLATTPRMKPTTMPSTAKPTTNAADPASKLEMRYQPTARFATKPAAIAPTAAVMTPTKIDEPQDMNRGRGWRVASQNHGSLRKGSLLARM